LFGSGKRTVPETFGDIGGRYAVWQKGPVPAEIYFSKVPHMNKLNEYVSFEDKSSRFLVVKKRAFQTVPRPEFFSEPFLRDLELIWMLRNNYHFAGISKMIQL